MLLSLKLLQLVQSFRGRCDVVPFAIAASLVVVFDFSGVLFILPVERPSRGVLGCWQVDLRILVETWQLNAAANSAVISLSTRSVDQMLLGIRSDVLPVFIQILLKDPILRYPWHWHDSVLVHQLLSGLQHVFETQLPQAGQLTVILCQ